MKRWIFLLPLLLAIFSCAQHKYGVVSAKGYFKESFPGAMPVDENGTPLLKGPDTVYLVFVEIKPEAKPKWEYAWTRGNSYRLVPVKIETKATVGKSAGDRDEVIVQPKAGNELYQLMMEKDEFAKPLPKGYSKKESAGSILLKGKNGDKDVFLEINDIVQLAPAMNM